MAEQKSNNNRWSCIVPGFQPRESPEHEEYQRPPPLARLYSISAAAVSTGAPYSELSKHAINSKLLKLKDKLKLVKEDYSELRQEASDLQEYSIAKLNRVTRYLGVLADRTRKLGEAALETEARLSPLITEKKRLFNDLLTAQACIHARRLIPEEDDRLHENVHASRPPEDVGLGGETDVTQWNVLQFNTGSTNPFIIKCGANSNSELVVKPDARIEESKGGEIVRVVPRPTVLENLSLDEIKQLFAQLPGSVSFLASAKTADGTRARYSRLYRTLVTKVPALKDLVGELEKDGVLKDVKS